jgi:DNA-binding MarR family transcriptional regulator
MTLGRLLALVYRCHMNELRLRLGQAGLEGLRPAHLLVFEHLQPEGSRITDLARRGHLTNQALVHLVNDLEEKGILERVPDPTDARAKLVRPTSAGRHTLLASKRVVAEIEESWAELLGPKLRTSLTQALEKLTAECYG